MKTLNEAFKEYKIQLEKGAIKKAYRGLMDFMQKTRIRLQKEYPDFQVSSALYQGNMDVTFFAFSPKSLKDKKLKALIVFIHDKVRFDIWLAGTNKGIQQKYWQFIKESGWNKYHVPASLAGVHSIVEHTLVDAPNFDDLDLLSRQIEEGTLVFIEEIDAFLSKNKSLS